MAGAHGRKPPMGKPDHGRKPSPPVQRSGRRTCCAMVAAYGAARRGRWPLARRYAVLSVRLIAAKMPVGGTP
jgi:hypothetical protein